MNTHPMAESDYSRAVRKGFWRMVSSWFTGEKNELLPFEEVKQRFNLKGQSYLGLRVVQMDQIVGSMGRYRDFDRAFLPRQTKTRDRWISIDSAHYDEIPLPPVELYKIGDVYFVKDGNHRVSVARERGQEMIDAYVTELVIPVHLTPDIDLDDLALKQEHARFVEQTRIHKLLPGVEIELTLPGEYDRILEHINTHRWYLGEQRGAEVSYEDALVSWYENVYQPLIELIEAGELLKEFPGRTEGDLSLWIIEYQWYRRAAYQEHFSLSEAAADFIRSCAGWPAKKLVRLLRDAAWVDNLILEQEQAAFLERTQILIGHPDAQIELTQPGQYEKLLEHISVHRWYLGEEQGHDVPFDQATISWYERVYLPLVEIIRGQKILDQFPGRTESDLYLWVLEHRAYLKDILGWEVDSETAATDLVDQSGDPPVQLGETLLEALLPVELESGPMPGTWRAERLLRRRDDRLFADILVPLSGEASSWRAFDQASLIARLEDSRLHGLHVVSANLEEQTDQVQEMQSAFQERAATAEISADLVIETGDVLREITRRSRWADLIVVPLNHPPGSGTIGRLGSGFRLLIRLSSRPLLAVPQAPTPFQHPLLAYDGSRTADEGLFLAASIGNRWKRPLTLLTVDEDSVPAGRVDDARRYLEKHAGSVDVIRQDGPVGETILRVAEQHQNDLIIMGGYGHHPVIEVVLGSALDQVLRNSRLPVLICK